MDKGLAVEHQIADIHVLGLKPDTAVYTAPCVPGLLGTQETGHTHSSLLTCVSFCIRFIERIIRHAL